MAWHRHVASHAQRTAATWHVVVASVAAEFSLDIELVTEVYFPLAAACRIEVMRVPQCLATRQRTAQSTLPLWLAGASSLAPLCMKHGVGIALLQSPASPMCTHRDV